VDDFADTVASGAPQEACPHYTRLLRNLEPELGNGATPSLAPPEVSFGNSADIVTILRAPATIIVYTKCLKHAWSSV
jgi:hypothetical protein